jgi:hypothetical protein
MTPLTRQLLDQEAAARRELAPAAYEGTLCTMLEGAAAAPHSAAQVRALLMLASAALRQSDPGLVALRACCAQALLAVRTNLAQPDLRRRIDVLFLLAWLQLGVVVERGPAAIAAAPPLPDGVMLPDGADPELIADPTLRGQARALAARWDVEVERWRAKQRALDEQTLLAALVCAVSPDTEDEEDALRVLASAMASAPGVPSALRDSLERAAGRRLP